MRVGIHTDLENTIDFLKDNMITLNHIVEKLGITRDSILNIRRLKNHNRATELLKQIQEAFPDYFENGEPKSSLLKTVSPDIQDALLKELREQIGYLKQQNKRLADENTKLINKLLDN